MLVLDEADEMLNKGKQLGIRTLNIIARGSCSPLGSALKNPHLGPLVLF